MPYVASIGTYLPCWGAPQHRVAGDDEDAVTMAACKRTSEVKIRWEAGQFTDADELDFPPRYRIASDGAVTTDYELVLLPRTGTRPAQWTRAWQRPICRRRGSARWAPPTDLRPGILADTLGLPDLPVTRIENLCATGYDAIRDALFAVASGAFDVALAMAADKLRDTNLWTCCGNGRPWRATWPATIHSVGLPRPDLPYTFVDISTNPRQLKNT